MLLFFSQLPLLLSRRWAFRSVAAGLFAQSPLGFLLNRRKGFVASLSLKPRRLFISLHEQRNEAKKFAVCTFLPTPALFSAKQKELASLKQLFVFHAPKSTSASRQKSEAGPYCFFATSLRSLEWGVFFFCFALFLSYTSFASGLRGEA